MVLHAALRVTGGERETRLASGAAAPMVVLGAADWAAVRADPLPAWPCAPLAEPGRRSELRAVLAAAGQARFEARVDAFAAELVAASRGEASERRGMWAAANGILWVALAEGLGYGRDRAALRELGLRLAWGMPPEEASERAARLGRIERARMAGLVALSRRWRERGPWDALRRALEVEDTQARARALVAALRVVEERGAVSHGRALILAANVGLPFAAARARLEGDAELGCHARELYAALPGLPSNSITRTMRSQLGMGRLPARASAHQGLHHIWATHCREKRCTGCPCAVGTASAPRR